MLENPALELTLMCGASVYGVQIQVMCVGAKLNTFVPDVPDVRPIKPSEPISNLHHKDSIPSLLTASDLTW